jgi:hypothetical protein
MGLNKASIGDIHGRGNTRFSVSMGLTEASIGDIHGRDNTRFSVSMGLNRSEYRRYTRQTQHKVQCFCGTYRGEV